MISVSFQDDSENEIHSGKDHESVSEINNSIFTMKLHQNPSCLSDESGHEVLFDVTFALAIPGIFSTTKSHDSKRASFSDQSARNSHQYFHIEFDLFSKEMFNECFKTDIGFYGSFAKIYPDKSESKVISTWNDGEDTWISWIQQFKFWITDRHIKDLCTHKMKITIWDTKDKCAPKVRFDRPKAPKSAGKCRSTNENCSWIKHTVLTMSKDYSSSSLIKESNDRILTHQIVPSEPTKRSPDKPNRMTKSAKTCSTVKSSISSPNLKVKEADQLILFVEPKSVVNNKLDSYSQLEKMLNSDRNTLGIKNKPSFSNRSSKLKSAISTTKESLQTSSVQQSDNYVVPESRKSVSLQIVNEEYHKNGRANFGINMADLFLKHQTINRISNSVNSLEDMFCRVAIEPDILSSNQKKRLNPLVIKIKRINNLPIDADKIPEINTKYKPLYCEYQFGDFPRYKTMERSHRKVINFDDVSIVLLGELSEIKIKEQLLNSFFTVQLFNRIKQESHGTNEMEHNVEEDMKNERNIGDINFTSAYKTVNTVFPVKPQGEARIDLSDIIKKNLKFLEVSIPIVPVSVIALKEDNENRTKHNSEDHNDFFQSETTMKVSFQLSQSLSMQLNSCISGNHYHRSVIVNNDVNCEFIRDTCTSFILKHNCHRFQFNNKDLSEMKQFIYSIKNESDFTDEVFTGFLVVDKKCEVLFVEGNEIHMKRFQEHCSEVLNNYRQKPDFCNSIKFLYNDSLVFNTREPYPILAMIPLVLSKDISFFASQPLLYVRDILPKTCVEGICRLNDLLKAESMQVVSRNNLIPSFQMIDDLSQYLCSHINWQMNNDVSDVPDKAMDSKLLARKLRRKQIKTAPVISHKSKEKGGNVSTKMQRSETYIYPDKDCEFSYSSQSKNAISSAMKEVRNQMNIKRRYTFSQNYLFSGTVDPVDLNDVYVAEEHKSKSEPRWIERGHRSIIEDCAESKKLSVSRIEDLKEPWIENELNSSFLKPTLPERDETDHYFDTYIRPLNLLDRSNISILPSYVTQKHHDKELSKINQIKWKQKLCVSDPSFKTHRLLTETELIERGIKSSNQIEKLKGLRKDDLKLINWVVRKYGDPNSISAISVLSKEETKNRSFTVGSDDDAHLSVNYIPINSKDKHFKSVYQPGKDNQIFKNTNPKITVQIPSPFSIPC